jgi:hypothetical protein
VNAVTVRFPGMRPAIMARAAEQGITEEEAWAQRQQEAEENLAGAARLLEQIRAGACEAWIPALNRRCGEMWPEDPARCVRAACAHEHVREALLCDLHIGSVANGFCLTCFGIDGHECPLAIVPIAEVTP